MTREEILAMSRQENKNKDLVAYEIEKQAGNAASITGAILCGILYLVQLSNGAGANLALWAVIVAMQAACYTVKAIRLRQKMHILLAVLTAILALLLSTAHLTTVINNSPALWSDEQMADITEMVE